jgi:hypothetical protein
LLLSRDDPAEYEVEYDDGSLSCLLFVLDEILFTLLLLLELCLPSFSFSFDDVREALLLLFGTTFDGALE